MLGSSRCGSLPWPRWQPSSGCAGVVVWLLAALVTAAIGLYGLKGTRAAGVMLLILGLVPIVLATRGEGAASEPSSAPVITGLLYL